MVTKQGNEMTPKQLAALLALQNQSTLDAIAEHLTKAHPSKARAMEFSLWVAQREEAEQHEGSFEKMLDAVSV
jgi:hypothetical protein